MENSFNAYFTLACVHIERATQGLSSKMFQTKVHFYCNKRIYIVCWYTWYCFIDLYQKEELSGNLCECVSTAVC